MKSESGSYGLLFHCCQTRNVEVGALGQLTLTPGYYIYIGSAFGPGGVTSRISHHRQISQRPHWHLDYLRPYMVLLEIWYTHDQERREHQWASTFAQLRGVRTPFNGFGASDCACPTHFFQLGFKPSFTGFRRRLRQSVQGHKRFYREVICE